MIRRGATLGILTILTFAVSAQAPVAVVERTATRGDVSTRVSVFSNRVVVMTVRRAGDLDFMRRMTLPEQQYLVYLATFQSNAEELGERPIVSRIDTANAEVLVVLHVGPDAPRAIRFSPMSGMKLPLAKIMGALDDLQYQVSEASPSAEAMRAWRPQKGDRVELMNGTRATVVEVLEEGIVILVHDRSYIRESVPPDARDQVILRVMEPEP
jgi:hypothetical protein